MAVVATSTATDPTHHLSLSDGTTTYGLILCNAAGLEDHTAISAAPYPRTAMKTTEGDPKYSDYEPPFSPQSQSDWSGGRGWDDHESNAARFFDSYLLDTTKGDLILGPKVTTTTGNASVVGKMFEYKGQLYRVGVNKLEMNGYRGVALSNASDKSKTFTSLNLSGVDLTGKVIRNTGGTGIYDSPQWRLITGNTTTGTNDTISVTPNWNVTQDTTTEFVVLGCDTWQEITGHGLTAIWDVLNVDDILYFAMGETSTMRRARFYNNAGTWTAEYADDGTNQATFLALQATETGTRKIWKAKSTASTVSCADPKAWGTDLEFKISDTVTEITCGNPATRISSLAIYGDPSMPYVLKEDGIGAIKDGVYAECPLSEFKAVRSEYNGASWVTQGVFLYLSFHYGLERFYNDDMQDMGPNRDEGLPIGRTGPIVNMVPYAGRFYAAVYAGTSGYSSILCYNGGWHEIYRGAQGKSIPRMYIQVIPGDSLDRLWFQEGTDIKWVPIAITPRQQTGYTYQTGGQLTTCWFHTGMEDVVKLFHSLKLKTESLSAGHQTVVAEYQTDNSTTWTSVGTFTVSPIQEIDLPANTTGKRIRFRLTLTTDDATKTPRVKAMVVESVARVPVKYAYQVTFRVKDENSDLNGDPDTYTAAETLTNGLRAWIDAGTPLTMRSVQSPFDNKTVWAEPPSYRPVSVNYDEQQETLIGTMQLIEI